MAPRFPSTLRAPRVLSAIFEDEASRSQSHSHARMSPYETQLPGIAEQTAVSSSFPFKPPRFTASGPPSYASEDGEADTSASEKQRRPWKDNRHIAKRGGWRRLVIIAAVGVVGVLALGLGLGLGLSHKKSKSSRDKDQDNSPSAAPFPAGSYSILAFLTNTSAACSSNAASWVCYPYTTYADAGSASSASFDWIIRPGAGAHFATHTVSSSDNLFSILFAGADLSLQGQDTDDEHYFFRIDVPRSTKPRQPLTDVNTQATCYFNQTRLEARLYTHIGSSIAGSAFQPPGGNVTVGDRTYTPWPYRVDVQQVSPPGGSVDCFDAKGAPLGSFTSNDGDCTCQYSNDPA